MLWILLFRSHDHFSFSETIVTICFGFIYHFDSSLNFHAMLIFVENSKVHKMNSNGRRYFNELSTCFPFTIFKKKLTSNEL